MARHHLINGVKVDFTKDEEEERDLEEQAWVDGAVAREWEMVRNKRNHLLAVSDWRGMSDLTMSDAWKTYRQALRDVGGQADPSNITWPEEPS
ncbi:MAG: phage tail assembly chaperone [bacterium]